MNRLGFLLILTAILGIPAFGLLGLTRNPALALSAHAMLVAGFHVLMIVREGSVKKAWKAADVAAVFSMHPAIIMLAGALFCVAGYHIAILVEPGTEANSMNKTDQVYFGCIFGGIGLGLLLTSLSQWLKSAGVRR